jgi:hypothetical protein
LHENEWEELGNISQLYRWFDVCEEFPIYGFSLLTFGIVLLVTGTTPPSKQPI